MTKLVGRALTTAINKAGEAKDAADAAKVAFAFAKAKLITHAQAAKGEAKSVVMETTRYKATVSFKETVNYNQEKLTEYAAKDDDFRKFVRKDVKIVVKPEKDLEAAPAAVRRKLKLARTIGAATPSLSIKKKAS